VKVTLLVVGRLKEAYFKAAEEELRKRIRPFCSFDLLELRDEAALLAAVPSSGHLYVFDERGESITSQAFSRDILGHEEQHGGGAPVFFAIGGADGHSDAVRARARRLLSFGKLTIAHRLVRLLVIEQIYRGFSILRGGPYHRE
jgi:23S rRNA (pseudouridine1915-N3)-methyltransferase